MTTLLRLTTLATLSGTLLALSACATKPANNPPEASSHQLSVVATIPQGPGNIAVSPSGRIFISLHQFYSPEYTVAEYHHGRLNPYPTKAWASPPGPDGVGMKSVLGLRCDRRGILWMLDNGSTPPRLVAWDTNREKLHRTIDITAPATRPGSFHNDFAIDDARHHIYIADIGGDSGPAIVAVDLKTGASRRMLTGHPSVSAQDVPMIIDGREVTMGEGANAKPARVGVNPITIDAASEWVYFGAMHGRDLYRIKAADLANPALSSDELTTKVIRHGAKPISDGITIDSMGNIYITDLMNHAIGVTTPDGQYRTLIQDTKQLSWPDGLSAGPEGWIHATVNQLHKSAPLNGGTNTATPPFSIVRFKSIAPTVQGR